MEETGRIDILVGATEAEGLIKHSGLPKDKKQDLLDKVDGIRKRVSNPTIPDAKLRPVGTDFRETVGTKFRKKLGGITPQGSGGSDTEESPTNYLDGIEQQIP